MKLKKKIILCLVLIIKACILFSRDWMRREIFTMGLKIPFRLKIIISKIHLVLLAFGISKENFEKL